MSTLTHTYLHHPFQGKKGKGSGGASDAPPPKKPKGKKGEDEEITPDTPVPILDRTNEDGSKVGLSVCPPTGPSTRPFVCSFVRSFPLPPS